MGYPGNDVEYADRRIQRISRWIDESDLNVRRDAEAATWGRLAKVAEESGEVIAAFISYTGQNPRKPRNPGALADVRKELLDVAVTALAAYEHLADDGAAVEAMFDHLRSLEMRAFGDSAEVRTTT